MNAPHASSGRRARHPAHLLLLSLALPAVLLPPQLAAAELLDSGQAPLLLARGGGGFSGGRGGGGFSGARSGFRDSGGAAGLNRGSFQPSGGWSNRVPGGASPGLSRPTATRPATRPANLNGSGLSNVNRPAPGGGNRDWGNAGQGLNRDGNLGTNLNNRFPDANRPAAGTWNNGRPAAGTWNGNSRFNGNVGANWNRNVNINNVNLSPGWARPGWGYARPWGFGWYGGWSSPPWGWWGANAALWGISTLASAAVINAAVDSAVSSNTTYIVVPDTSYQLLFGTVQPQGTQGVSFMVEAGGATYSLSADCNLGTINGVAPTSAAQAQLLNAACQVAYGAA